MRVADLAVLRHARIRRLGEGAHIQRSGARENAAHVGQALKGYVLVGVAGHHQAGLADHTRQGLHCVRPQRTQDVARLIHSRQVAPLLQLPREVGARLGSDGHGRVDEPCGTGTLDDRGRERTDSRGQG